MDFGAWIVANSITLIGCVFYAGQMFNRIRNVEARIKEVEDHHEVISAQAVAIAILSQKIESLTTSIDSIRDEFRDSQPRRLDSHRP